MSKIQILCPPVAILDANNEPDAFRMGRYFNWMADRGVNGLFLNGSTGEFTILTEPQKVATVRIAKEAVGDRMFLIAGAIMGAPRLVTALASQYKEAGADAIAVCAPPFFRHSQNGILEFMTEVADTSPLPVFLYDIPAFTSPMALETILQLAKHPNVHGLKDSSRDFPRFQGILSAIKPQRPEFKIFTGTEELLLASLIMGADGATVATAGIEPDKIMAIVNLYQQGRLEEARAVQFELLPMIRQWFAKDFPLGFRDAVAAKGFL